MTAPAVVLVSMPWDTLKSPSIQLGILRAVLDRAGVATETRSLKLAFMEHCRRATAERADDERPGVEDYERVGCQHSHVGLGDWIFAVPPFRQNTRERDEEYLAYAGREGVPKADLAKAVAMRELAPAFLEQCADVILAAAPGVVGFTTAFFLKVTLLFF
jgi:hypothetical protein